MMLDTNIVRRWRAMVRQRMLLLGELRAVGIPLTAALCAVQLLRGLLPAASALLAGALVRDVLAAARQTTAHATLAGLSVSLAVLGGTLLANQAVELIVEPIEFVVARRVDGAHRHEVRRMVLALPTVDRVEDSELQNLVTLASSDAADWWEHTPGAAVAGQVWLMARFVGAAANAAVIAQYSWLLAIGMTIPLLVMRSTIRRQWMAFVGVWVAHVADGKRAGYWTDLSTDAAVAKEVRVFNLGAWTIGHFRRHALSRLQPYWDERRRVMRGQWFIALLTLGTMLSGILALGIAALRGHLSAGQLTMTVTAVWGLFNIGLMGMEAFDLEGGIPVLMARRSLRDSLAQAQSTPPPGAAHSTPVFTRERAAQARPTPTEPGPPTITFSDVWFAYPNAGRAVLRGLHLEIRPREVIGLVGLNGAGKTTLMKLMAGLYRPTRGSILVDGIDLRDMDLTAWRSRLSVVFQDFLKYELSARENVTLGAPGSRERTDLLGTAARRAGIEDLLATLPDGWATPLSRARTGGVDLSGGQWQRVALARALFAMYAGAQVLVLDEPTAHLDVRAEFEVFQRIVQAAEEASVVLVSHRLSTLRRVDRIVTLQDGAIVESGNHEQLMTSGGHYSRLFALQAQRFAIEAHRTGGTDQ